MSLDENPKLGLKRVRTDIDLTGGLSDFRESRTMKRNMEREDSRSPLRKVSTLGERQSEVYRPSLQS